MPPLLFDTDILIDYLRGRSEAVAFLDSQSAPFLMSAITLAELFAGVREGAERTALETFVSAFDIVPIEESLAVAGGLLRRDWSKSHGVGLADALIAATALERGATLVTLNGRHFPMLKTVLVPYTKS